MKNLKILNLGGDLDQSRAKIFSLDKLLQKTFRKVKILSEI